MVRDLPNDEDTSDGVTHKSRGKGDEGSPLHQFRLSNHLDLISFEA